MARAHVIIPFTLLLAACGGDETEPAAPPRIDGAFLMLFGAQRKTIALGPEVTQVNLCRPKPALKEFEYDATNGADSFKLLLKDYVPTQSAYEMLFKAEAGKLPHQVDVILGTGHKYKFFEATRSDVQRTYPSRCQLDLQPTPLDNRTRYDARLTCVMLWADTTSKDYGNGALNNYIDLVSKFSCEY